MSKNNSVLAQLREQCAIDHELLQAAEQSIAWWHNWLLPINAQNPVGDDISYDDDYQQIRDAVNQLSDWPTMQICQLAEGLLCQKGKDLRVAGYYIWARLHQEGEAGFAQSLALLAGLLQQYGQTLYPNKHSSQRLAIEWLNSSKMADSLARYPELDKEAFRQIVALLSIIDDILQQWAMPTAIDLAPLIKNLEHRLQQAGGMQSIMPQNTQVTSSASEQTTLSSTNATAIKSGRELFEQAKHFVDYLKAQPQGYLASARIMRVIRWDTVHQLPLIDDKGNCRLPPPRSEAKNHLKRLYLQQDWLALLEQTERFFLEGVNHFWLDLQWYCVQALKQLALPYRQWAGLIEQELLSLLERLPHLEQQTFNDGTPFADEVTKAWIIQCQQQQQLLLQPIFSQESKQSANVTQQHYYELEQAALARADNEGIDKALAWLAEQPQHHYQQQWWLRLIMARIAEQYGKNDLAFHLLIELDKQAMLPLIQWQPDLLFDVKARLLKLLRLKSQRHDSDKKATFNQIEQLLGELTVLDPVRATVLYP